jgi:hypothetical protein
MCLWLLSRTLLKFLAIAVAIGLETFRLAKGT